jgi:hypothetical protein
VIIVVSIKVKGQEKMKKIGNPGMSRVKNFFKHIFGGYSLNDLETYFPGDEIEQVDVGLHSYRKRDGRWQELYIKPSGLHHLEIGWVDKGNYDEETFKQDERTFSYNTIESLLEVPPIALTSEKITKHFDKNNAI